MKRSGRLKRKTPLKRTRLRRVSKKRGENLSIYRNLRDAYLGDNPFCQFRADDVRYYGCGRLAKDIHHKAGRYGKNLIDQNTFMSICRWHHTWIHNHPNRARKLGYLK